MLRLEATKANSLRSWAAMSSSKPEALWGLPPVLPFEAPGSWLSRASQSQGVCASVFVIHLGMRPRLDSDFFFLSRRFPSIAKACGLAPGAFAEARQVMASIRKLDIKGDGLLFRSGRRARYRYCPRCFLKQRTPHFHLQSRLEAWRSCPEHGCMMEDACWRCSTPIELPFSPGIDGSHMTHCHSLGQCISCGANLRDAPVVDLNETVGCLSEWERLVLYNGQVLPAALFQRRVFVADGLPRPFAHVTRLLKQGMLARPGHGPTASRLRARMSTLSGRVDGDSSGDPPEVLSA